MNNEQFEIATFESDTDTAIVLEGGLSFKDAVSKAEALWQTGEHYGVEVVSQDPNSIEPIQWIKTKSEFIESFGLADEKL